VAEASNQSKEKERYGIKTEDKTNLSEEPPEIWQSPYLSAIITGRLSYWQKTRGALDVRDWYSGRSQKEIQGYY